MPDHRLFFADQAIEIALRIGNHLQRRICHADTREVLDRI